MGMELNQNTFFYDVTNIPSSAVYNERYFEKGRQSYDARYLDAG